MNGVTKTGRSRAASAHGLRGWPEFPLSRVVAYGTWAGQKAGSDSCEAPTLPLWASDCDSCAATSRIRVAGMADANLAIRNRRESGLIALDVDPRPGGDGKGAE